MSKKRIRIEVSVSEDQKRVYDTFAATCRMEGLYVNHQLIGLLSEYLEKRKGNE